MVSAVPAAGVFSPRPPTPRLAAYLPVRPPEKDWTLLFYNAGYADESKMCTAGLEDLERVGSDAHTSVAVMNFRSPWLPEKLLGMNREFDGARTYALRSGPVPSPAAAVPLPSDARRFLDFVRSSPKHLTSPMIDRKPAVNMGERGVFERFLLDGMRRFPARHTAVIVSGHGAAFAGNAIVHHPEGRMRNEEIGDVLRDVAVKTGRRIDLVNLNTCYGANLETLYPLRGAADAAVASEGVVFAGTQPFGSVLHDLQRGLEEGRDLDGRDLARLFVEESRRQPLGNLYTETLSAVDLDRVGAVADAVKALQETLVREGVAPALIRDALERSMRLDYSGVPRPVFVTDLGSFAGEIAARAGSGAVAEKAGAVQSALRACVVDEEHADHRRETATTLVLRRLAHRAEQDLSRLSGMTVYYDDDIDGGGSRREALRQTEYAADVGAEAFLRYLSSGKPAPTGLRRTLTELGEQHAVLAQTVTHATHVPYLLPVLERVGTGAAMLAAFHALSAAGIPAYPLGFGTWFTVRGALSVGRGLRDGARLLSLEKRDGAQRESLVTAASGAALGAATLTFGLYLLGALPRAVAWPAAIVAGAVQVGRELGKLAARRSERTALLAEAKAFAAADTSEKLNPSSNSQPDEKPTDPQYRKAGPLS